jgi:hypothetical protein
MKQTFTNQYEANAVLSERFANIKRRRRRNYCLICLLILFSLMSVIGFQRMLFSTNMTPPDPPLLLLQAHVEEGTCQHTAQGKYFVTDDKGKLDNFFFHLNEQ